MTTTNNAKVKVKEYQEALLLIEKNLKYIEAIGVDKSLLQTYRRILNYLNDKSISEIQEIFDESLTKKKQVKTPGSQLTEHDISKLGRDEVKNLVASQKLTRSTLERIASTRFSIPKGSLSVLRTREALIQKILTLLSHEDTHEAISRAALRSQTLEISQPKDE
ncbi:hypothetical protein [Serratia proteamaculans]|uniref:hypothetical protein n=1 Tax=Serratia proteamaculans TaxID=28151 RepID=UPI0039AF7AD2